MSTEKEEIGVAKEVLSYCGKCKLPLAHVIIDMKDETTIGKCQCKTCNAKHNYRDPVAEAKKKASPTTKRKVAIPVGEIWKSAVATTDGRAKPYAMDKRFQAGDLMDHATFGQGVVMQLVQDDKIEVQFEDSLKLLVCAPAPTE